jgi:hypothetical protein
LDFGHYRQRRGYANGYAMPKARLTPTVQVLDFGFWILDSGFDAENTAN